MRQFLAIILIVIVFLQAFSSFVIEANYFLNKSYIAKVLCINKEKPKTHCNGKCFLSRQLKQQEKEEQQTPNPTKEKFEVQPFFLPKSIDLINVSSSPKVKYYYTDEIINSIFLRSVFHPPTV